MLLVFLITGIVAFADDLFPEIEDWKLVPYDRVYVPGNLWDLINGAADAYLSYDFQDLHLADYQNEEGVNIRVELYRHSTYNNAYGIYTTERSPDYEFIDIGLEGYQEEGILNFQCGLYYIKMSCFDEAEGIDENMLMIATKVRDKLNQEIFQPKTLNYFPEMEPHTDHYIAENFLGFDFLHSAFIAPYKVQDQEYQLFIIYSDDPEVVRGMLHKYFAFTKQDIEVKEGRYTVKDPYNGDVEVLLVDQFLAGIVDCDDPELRAKVLDQLKNKLDR